jgi:UDP-glucuronate decarboxylase
MASELTYRGGAGAPGSASDGGEYSPKPSKPLSWLTRAARYAAAEHRPAFALAGMLLAAALFSLYAPSSDASSSEERWLKVVGVVVAAEDEASEEGA